VPGAGGFIAGAVVLFAGCTELHAGSNPKIVKAASQLKKRSDRLFIVFGIFILIWWFLPP
jgi:hypothetical protein